MKTVYFCILSFFLSSVALGDSVPTLPSGQVATEATNHSVPDWLKHIRMNYFSFFDGPGLGPGKTAYTPNVLGKPIDDGLRFTNYVSLKYDLSPTLAFDFQMRIQFLLNNANSVNNFDAFRWQSPRTGVSGKLISGKDWSLTGAINTDLPYFIPQPLGSGVVAQERTTLLDPGLFAKFSYTPRGSKWSIFSLVMPRFFIYKDRNVAEPQLSRAGFSPTLKNEFTFSVSPSVNYALTSATGLRFGTEFTYNKLIISRWNPFNGSLNNSNTHSDAWRLAPLPLQFGITHEFSEALNVSAFVQGFPIAAQRIRSNGSQVNFINTTSIGMWISGAII